MKFPSTSSQGNPLSNSTGTTTSITTTSTMAVDQVKKINFKKVAFDQFGFISFSGKYGYWLGQGTD